MLNQALSQKERMQSGMLYNPDAEPLPEDLRRSKLLCWQYNQCNPLCVAEREAIIRSLLGKTGERFNIEPNFFCDYGYNIEVGENFYANHNLVILDVAPVKIGANAMFGPNVSIITAGHPVHPRVRLSGYEFGEPITIGDNVWLGAKVTINPGVTIGDNVVVASGSVVTKNLESDCIYSGVPAHLLRPIGPRDLEYYFKDRPIDVEF